MKGLRKKILVFITAFAMFATTFAGVYATDGVEEQKGESKQPVTIQQDSPGENGNVKEEPKRESKQPISIQLTLSKDDDGTYLVGISYSGGSGDYRVYYSWELDDDGKPEPKRAFNGVTDDTTVSPDTIHQVTAMYAEDAEQAEDLSTVPQTILKFATYDVTAAPTSGKDGSITVTWGGDASKSYVVKAYAGKTVAATKTVTGTTATFNNLANKKYTFKVESTDGIIYPDSNACIPEFSPVGNVKSLKTYATYSAVLLEWEPVEGANGYYVERWSSDGKTRQRTSNLLVSKIDKLSYFNKVNGKYQYLNDSDVKNDRNYMYKVYAVNYDSEGTRVERSAKAATKTDGCVRPMYITVYTKTNKTLSSCGGKKGTLKLKAGAKIEKCYKYSRGRYYFKKNGSVYRIARINCKKQKAYFIGKDSWNYTTKEAELFVAKYLKEQKISSGTKDLLWVSYYTQRLYWLKKKDGQWKIYKNWDCSTGKASTPSPTGNKQINQYRYRTLVGIPYWSCYSGKNGIHGKRPDYVLGEPHSHGCIRNTNANAKLIYYNVKRGTRVICY